MFAYDVNCQYCVRFWSRFQNAFLRSSIPTTATLLFLIGLFHVHGHKEVCLARFAPTFVPGAGVVSGEILESLWSTLIGAAKSTRQMTLAFRAATLNACMLDSNVKKLLSMGAPSPTGSFPANPHCLTRGILERGIRESESRKGGSGEGLRPPRKEMQPRAEGVVVSSYGRCEREAVIGKYQSHGCVQHYTVRW